MEVSKSSKERSLDAAFDFVCVAWKSRQPWMKDINQNKISLNRPVTRSISSSSVKMLNLPSTPNMPTLSEVVENERELIMKWKKQLSNQLQNLCEAVFVLGPMGAGKTTFIKEQLKSHEHYSQYGYVDTDEIMELLDGYSEDDVGKYYPIARHVAIHLTDWLLEEKISFVAEGTCVQYEELKDYMIRLKEKGYTIKVCHIDCPPLEDCLSRARKRERRKVSDEVVEEIYHGTQLGFQKLQDWNQDGSYFTEIPKT